MTDNKTGVKCDICSSHVHKYKQDNTVIVECMYCGSKIEEYDCLSKVGDLYGEDEDMFLWKKN